MINWLWGESASRSPHQLAEAEAKARETERRRVADLAELAAKHEKELPRWVQGDAVMATQPDHIHMVGDGRGQRDVYLNGKRLKNVIYANTRTGKVRLHDDPPKVHKYGKRLIVRTLRGAVEVVARNAGC